MKVRKRVELSKALKDDPCYISYQSLSHVKSIIDKLIKEYGKDAVLEIESTDEYGYDSATAYIEYEREETKEEKQERLKKDKENKEWRKKQYERLKKEFEEK